MAEVDPVLLAVGTVREIVKNEFQNVETGELEDRGHKVTLLTRVGFLQFNLPTGSPRELFSVGAPVVAWLRFKRWNFRGRDGVTLIFESVASAEVAEALSADLLAAAI